MRTGDTVDRLDALMAQYAAGMLPEPARVLVAAHLEMKTVNHAKVADFEVTAGTLLEEVDPVALTSRDAALDAVLLTPPLATLEQVADDRPAGMVFPRALRDFIGFEVEDIPWKTKMPGFKEFTFGKVDGCEVGFHWIRAGRSVPAHTHEGFELSLILDGAYNDVRGRFGRGDISVADDSIDHRPVAEKDRPCIAFSVTDAPLKLTGSYRQLLRDLIG